MSEARGMGDKATLLTSEKLISMARDLGRGSDSVAVRGDSILDVGPRGRMPDVLGEDVTTYDFGNRPIMPGFVDIHVHPEMASLALYNRVDVHTPPRETIDDVIQAFRERMDMAEETGWLFGHGSLFQDQKLKDKRLPNRHDLDKVSTDIPVAMMAGGHNLILNSKALEMVGIGPGYRVPAGATVELEESGQPNGILKDLEHLLPIPRPDLSTKERALRAIASEQLTANGVTTIGDISHSTEGVELADRLIANGKINVRFRTYIWVPRLMSIKDACRWQDHLTINSDEKHMRIQGVKMFADGGYSAALAAVKLPYVGRNGSRGKLALNRRQILNAMVGTREAGLQLIIHCNGERAQESMCKVAIELGDPPTGRMVNRMEHAGNFVSDTGTRELWRKAGLMPAPQAVFLYTFGDYFPVYMGDYASQGRFSFRTMIDEGWELPCSSDGSGSEVRHFNPFFSIWAAVKRQTFTGQIIDPDQRVSMEEALKMHTIYPAAALGEQDVKGSLEPGKLADIVVLDRDPMNMTGDELLDVKVDYVFLGGKEVYRRPGAEPYATS